jgi:hypothetical protein
MALGHKEKATDAAAPLPGLCWQQADPVRSSREGPVLFASRVRPPCPVLAYRPHPSHRIATRHTLACLTVPPSP